MVGVVGDGQGCPGGGRAIVVLVGNGVAASAGGRNVDFDLAEFDVFAKVKSIGAGDWRGGIKVDIVGASGILGGCRIVGKDAAVVLEGVGNGASEGVFDGGTVDVG